MFLNLVNGHLCLHLLELLPLPLFLYTRISSFVYRYLGSSVVLVTKSRKITVMEYECTNYFNQDLSYNLGLRHSAEINKFILSTKSVSMANLSHTSLHFVFFVAV